MAAEQLVVCEVRNPYLATFFAAKGLKPGDKWLSYEYMQWIDSKHSAFQKEHRLSHPLYDEDTKALFIEFLKQEALLECHRSHGKPVRVLIPINNLASRCGYFFNASYNDGPCVNNGYNCRHPDVEQEDGVGCCYMSECPIAYPADGLVCKQCGSTCESCGEESCDCDLDMMVAEIPANEFDPAVMDLIPDDGENT